MGLIREGAGRLAHVQPMPEHDGFDLPYIFAAGGLLGTAYELLLTLALRGVLEDRSGSVLTPFNYVYGTGAVAVFLLMRRLKKPLPVFALGAVLGGVLEYGLSLCQEYMLGSRSWDYSAKPLNISGRTTVPYMLVWGVLCYISICFLFPALLKLLHRVPSYARRKIALLLVGLLSVDVLVTAVAVLRYAQRAGGIYFNSRLLNAADTVFNDAFMRIHFPNMRLS